MSVFRLWLGFGLFCLTVLAPLRGRAETALVLGVNSTHADAEVAHTLTRALRASVEQQPYWDLAPAEVSLQTLNAGRGCDSANTLCVVRHLADLARVNHIFFGSLRPTARGNRYQVTLYRFGARSGRVERTLADVVRPADLRGALLTSLARRYAADLTARKATVAVVGLESQPENAAFASLLASAIRRQAARSPFFDLVDRDPSVQDFADAQDCARGDMTCLASVLASAWSVDRVIFGRVCQAPAGPGRYRIALFLYDASTWQVSASVKDTLLGLFTAPTQLNAQASGYIQELLTPGEEGLAADPNAACE